MNIDEIKKLDETVNNEVEFGMRIFRVKGWGEVGGCNLYKFIPNPGEASQYDLKVGQSCYGKTPDGPEKITRLS